MSARRLISNSRAFGNCGAFFLTPALSRWERKNCFQFLLKGGANGCIPSRELQRGVANNLTRCPLFPSPSGRGSKGEGGRVAIAVALFCQETSR